MGSFEQRFKGGWEGEALGCWGKSLQAERTVSAKTEQGSLACSRTGRSWVWSCGQRSSMATGKVGPCELGKEIGFYSMMEAVGGF